MEPIVKILSGVALLTVVTCIARIGFASFVTARAWDEAFQAAALFFFLRFGESRFIAPTEVILGILLGAVVGCLSALLRSWTPTVLTIGAAMILIHHPSSSKARKDAVAKHTAPSLGFWQLLLATFGFVYRSAAGGGLHGGLCAAFTHVVMLASAAELLAVLSPPGGPVNGGEAAVNEVEPGAPPESLRPVGSLPRVPSLASGAMSPASWGASAGPRHGATSPKLGPPWRSSWSQLRSPTKGEPAVAPAGQGPRRSRRSSLPPFFEGGEHERLTRLLLPPTASRVGAGEGARGAIGTRASCPVVPPGMTRAGTLLRSASAAAVNAPAWHSGSGAAGAAAASGTFPSVFAISASPMRCSAGRSRVPGIVPTAGRAAGAAGGTDSAGVAEEGEDSSLPGGSSPDGQFSQARRAQDRSVHRQDAPWESSGCATVVAPSDAAAAEPVSEIQAAAAGCDADGDVGSANGDGGRQGSGRVATQACEAGEAVAVLAEARAGPPLQFWSVRGGDGATDPRVSGVAAGDGQLRCRYRRETGNSTQEYILLASTTVPETDGPAAYGSEFSSEDDEEEEAGHENEDDDDDSELYEGKEEDDMDGGVSDGCFSLVIDTNSTPLGDCMVGVNRALRGAQGQNGPADVAAAAAAVAAWVDAGAAAAAAGVFEGYADGMRAAGGDHVVALAAAGVNGVGPATDGHNAEAAKPARAGDGGGRDSTAVTSADARGAATRGAVPHGPQPPDLYGMATVRHAVLDRHGCDVADMADFEDEDLMSLQEEEAGLAAAVAGDTGGEQLGPLTLPNGGSGGEDFNSHAAAQGPRSSALTSEAQCTAASQRRLQHPAELSDARWGAAAGGIVAARVSASGAGPSGYGGGVVDGASGGQGVLGKVTGSGVGRKRRQQQQYRQQEFEGCGEEWRVDYVPLQADTLARHTAAINAYEQQQQQGDDLVQQQQQQQGDDPMQQQQQQLSWQRAEADGPEQDHAGAAACGAGHAARGSSPRAQAAPSLRLLDSFLRDAALLAGVGDEHDSGVGHESCGVVGLPCDAAAGGDCLNAGAAGEQQWAPLDGRVGSAAAAAVGWDGGPHLHSRRRHEYDRPRHSKERKPRRVSRHRDLPRAQQSGDMRLLQQQSYPGAHEQRLPHEAAGSSSRRSGRLAQQHQADRARGRRPHVRKLSAGQLLAREVISRYDQDCGHMYGNMYGTAQPPDLCQHQAYPSNRVPSVPLTDGLWQPPQQQQGELSPGGAVAAAATACGVPLLAQCPQAWEDELLQTFELSGFDDAHLPLPPQPPSPQHTHQHERSDSAWLPQPGDYTASLADRVWGWLGSPDSPHAAPAPQAPAPPPGGPCAWGGAVAVATDWYDAVSSSGGGWGGGAAAIATAASGLLASPQQQLRCASAAPTSPGPVNPFASAPGTAASAPSTPPTTVVEPFSVAGQSQAVYRSLSGTRRYEEVDKADRRKGISDNYKAALAAAAAAAAAGNRSGPTTPVAASRPPGSPPPPTAPPSEPPDPPLPNSSSMPPLGQAQLSGQEAPGGSGGPQRRLPAVVVGGSASRALFPEEAMPLSADHNVVPRGGEGPAPVAAAAHQVLLPAGEVTMVTAADLVTAAVGEVVGTVVESTVMDCGAIAMKEAMAEVQAAPSESTDVLSRLTIPSEVWTGLCNGTESVMSATAALPGPPPTDTASPSWAAASEVGDDVIMGDAGGRGVGVSSSEAGISVVGLSASSGPGLS